MDIRVIGNDPRCNRREAKAKGQKRVFSLFDARLNIVAAKVPKEQAKENLVIDRKETIEIGERKQNTIIIDLGLRVIGTFSKAKTRKKIPIDARSFKAEETERKEHKRSRVDKKGCKGRGQLLRLNAMEVTISEFT